MTQAKRLTSIRLYPGVDDDLLAWWEALPGNKTEAVKAAIRRGIDAGSSAQNIDLAAIRNVVEAALETRLSVLRLATTVADAPTETDESDALLDAIATDLLV